MVINIGSMAVKAVFNGAGLLSGLGKTSDKFKEVSQRSKSTTTEMKRMQHGAHKLRGALAAIGIGGFAALLMTTPQLAGSLAKIKYEMQQLAWSVGKELKPSLDAVATILQGIRTGDWNTVIDGVNDLTNALINLVGKGVDIILKPIIGEEATKTIKTDFNNWINKIKTSLEEGDIKTFLTSIFYDPFKWIYDNSGTIVTKINDIMGAISGKLFKLREGSPLDKFVQSAYDIDRWIGQKTYDITGVNIPVGQKIETRQIGGYVPQSGLYNLHAGETVTMKGSSGMTGNMGSSNITLDFSGANINLASGIELNEFADTISKKIAERQNTLTY